MAFSIDLDSTQVAEIICEELGRIIKTEIDRMKDGHYCNNELIEAVLTILHQYLSDNDIKQLNDAIQRYMHS